MLENSYTVTTACQLGLTSHVCNTRSLFPETFLARHNCNGFIEKYIRLDHFLFLVSRQVPKASASKRGTGCIYLASSPFKQQSITMNYALCSGAKNPPPKLDE